MALRSLQIVFVAAPLVLAATGCSTLRSVEKPADALSSGRADASSLTHLAELYEQRGHYSGAMRLYRRALLADPTDVKARSRLDALAARESGPAGPGGSRGSATANPLMAEKGPSPRTTPRPAPSTLASAAQPPVGEPDPLHRLPSPIEARPVTVPSTGTPQWTVTPAGHQALVNATMVEVAPEIEIRPQSPPPLYCAQEAGDAPAWARTDLKRLCRGGSQDLLAIVSRLEATDVEVRKEALIDLAGRGRDAAPAAPAVRSLLCDASDSVRVHAAWAACRIEGCADDCVALLAELVGSQNLDIAQLAAYCLGSLGPDAALAIPALRTECDSDCAEVRIVAAEALLSIEPGEPEAAAILFGALSGADASGRYLAALALTGTAPEYQPAAILALIRTLNDPEEEVCSAAALALGSFGAASREAVPVLEALALNSSADVCEAASAALACIVE